MKNKIIVLVSGILVILLMVFGVSFAVFRYGETGTNQEMVLGDIWMKYEENNGITLENALPGEEYTNYFEFYVMGTNTYTKKDIWYDISLTEGDIASGKVESNRIEDKYLRFRLTEVVNGIETEIFKDKTYNDLTNKRIYVDKISKSTNEYSKTYRLYMAISPKLTYGNSADAILTTEEFGNIFGSIKVNVTGDFNEKELPPTDESCFTTYETTIYFRNENMTEEEINLCASYLIDNTYIENNLDEGSTMESFCQGEGTSNNNTFQDYINLGLDKNELLYLVDNNIVTTKEGIKISGYDTSCGTDVIIQNKINNIDVISIGEHAFEYNQLTSIVIPEGIISIERGAFEDNSLTSIIIPSSVMVIYSDAFYNNQIENLVLNEGLKVIGQDAFAGNNIDEIVIPESTEKYYCTTFDEDVTIINSLNLICTENCKGFWEYHGCSD